MNKKLIAVAVAMAIASAPGFSFEFDETYSESEDVQEYCLNQFDPIVCSEPENFSDDGNYVHRETYSVRCEDFAKPALLKFFSENEKFAVGVHSVNKNPVHELTFVERDFVMDTKSSFGCAMGLETKLDSGLNPFTHIRYSISETYTDGTVIYINDFKYIGVIDF
jgi:hypothetical protein